MNRVSVFLVMFLIFCSHSSSIMAEDGKQGQSFFLENKKASGKIAFTSYMKEDTSHAMIVSITTYDDSKRRELAEQVSRVLMEENGFVLTTKPKNLDHRVTRDCVISVEIMDGETPRYIMLCFAPGGGRSSATRADAADRMNPVYYRVFAWKTLFPLIKLEFNGLK